MNLKDAVLLLKKNLKYSNEKLAQYFGVSRNEVLFILHGHTNLRADTLIRISNILRVSMDELMDHQFIPPSYHFSEQLYSVFVTADKDYPEFLIAKGDQLYVRPFVHEPKKIGKLIVVRQGDDFWVERYMSDPQDYLREGKQIDYVIVGTSRFLADSDDDVNPKAKLDLNAHGKPRKRMGRPIKH